MERVFVIGFVPSKKDGLQDRVAFLPFKWPDMFRSINVKAMKHELIIIQWNRLIIITAVDFLQTTWGFTAKHSNFDLFKS